MSAKSIKKVVPIGYRKVVPRGYQQATLTLEGTSALLMNSGEADRDGETYRAYFNLGHARNKSLEQEAQLRRLEWTLALYIDDEVGPYLPGKNVKELLRSAATKWKKGEDIKRSLVVVEYRVPLQYDGPEDADGLWDEGFRDERMVANAGINRGRVLRCRPKFEDWGLTCTLAFDPEDLDYDLLEMIVDRSQKFGLGDYRPEFGSFKAQLEAFEAHTASPNGKAVKPRRASSERAHGAQVERVLG